MRKPYAVRVEEEIIKKLKISAAEEGKKVYEIIDEALKDYFKKKGRE